MHDTFFLPVKERTLYKLENAWLLDIFFPGWESNRQSPESSITWSYPLERLYCTMNTLHHLNHYGVVRTGLYVAVVVFVVSLKEEVVDIPEE